MKNPVKDLGASNLLMSLYFCHAKHSLLERGGAQMRGGAVIKVTERQAYRGISIASIIIFTESDKN